VWVLDRSLCWYYIKNVIEAAVQTRGIGKSYIAVVRKRTVARYCFFFSKDAKKNQVTQCYCLFWKEDYDVDSIGSYAYRRVVKMSKTGTGASFLQRASGALDMYVCALRIW